MPLYDDSAMSWHLWEGDRRPQRSARDVLIVRNLHEVVNLSDRVGDTQVSNQANVFVTHGSSVSDCVGARS